MIRVTLIITNRKVIKNILASEPRLSKKPEIIITKLNGIMERKNARFFLSEYKMPAP